MREILAALDAALVQDDHARARGLMAEISDLLDVHGRRSPVDAHRSLESEEEELGREGL
jgi:hypothetical protein